MASLIQCVLLRASILRLSEILPLQYVKFDGWYM